MLLNLHKKKWTDGLTLRRFDSHSKTNEQTVQVSEVFINSLVDVGEGAKFCILQDSKCESYSLAPQFLVKCLLPSGVSNNNIK